MIPVFFQKTWEAVQTTGNRLVIWITAFVPRIADNEAVEYWRQIVPLRHPNPTLPAIATEPDSVLQISRHCIGGVLVSVRYEVEGCENTIDSSMACGNSQNRDWNPRRRSPWHELCSRNESQSAKTISYVWLSGDFPISAQPLFAASDARRIAFSDLKSWVSKYGIEASLRVLELEGSVFHGGRVQGKGAGSEEGNRILSVKRKCSITPICLSCMRLGAARRGARERGSGSTLITCIKGPFMMRFCLIFTAASTAPDRELVSGISRSARYQLQPAIRAHRQPRHGDGFRKSMKTSSPWALERKWGQTAMFYFLGRIYRSPLAQSRICWT